MLHIALKSLLNRWHSGALAVLAIAMSVALILSVEKVRQSAYSSFTQTVSGTDLIVGARSGSIQLLLYSVFRIGDATNNISWESVEAIRNREAVSWTIPLSLGDSHRGYRVLGTEKAYFEHYRHGSGRALEINDGRVFDDVFDAVIGSEVARELGYQTEQSIVIAHGTGKIALVEHDKQPFRVSGILAATGTPVDRTIHVSLQGIEAMHVDWRSGMALPGAGTPAEAVRAMDLQPEAVTAVLVGLTSRSAVFREQRQINEFRDEPLLAILPGVAIQELWNLVGVAEKALMIVSGFVVFAGIVNLVSVLVAGLNERRREMAILRASGARPSQMFLLLSTESAVLGAAGILLGTGMYYCCVLIGGAYTRQNFGLELAATWLTRNDLIALAVILAAALLAGSFPAWQAYRQTLADGMMQRL